MTSPEARRHDLYNGLTEILGTDRADTLMDYLPSTESTDLATKADITSLDARIDRLEANISGHIDTLGARIDALAARIDRIVLAIIAALVVVIARSFF